MSSEALQKALKLADALENGDSYESHSRPVYGWERDDPCFDAADALRGLVNQFETQAARIAELEAEVERLRKPLTPEAAWQLWSEVCKPERPTVDLVEAFARAIEAAKEAK